MGSVEPENTILFIANCVGWTRARGQFNGFFLIKQALEHVLAGGDDDALALTAPVFAQDAVQAAAGSAPDCTARQCGCDNLKLDLNT